MQKHHGKDNIYYRIPYLSTTELLELKPILCLLSEGASNQLKSPYHHTYYALMAELDSREKQQKENGK